MASGDSMTQQYQSTNINSPRGARSVVSDQTLTPDDDVVVIDGGAPSLTLPSATLIPGLTIFIKSSTGTGEAVTIPGQNIDGDNVFTFSAVNQGLLLKSNGSNWLIVSDTEASGGMSRRTYGSVVGVFDTNVNFPIDVTSLLANAQKRGHLDLFSSITSYADCLWDVEVSQGSTNTTHTGLTFSNRNEIVDWINANVTTFGGRFNQTATFHAYDIVNGSIVPVDKIYGKNTIMSRMRGNGRYWSPIRKTAATSSWSEQPGFLESLWTSVWGVPMGPSPFTDAEMACFWYSQNRQRMYQIGVAPAVRVQTANGRNMLRVGDGARVSATLTTWAVTGTPKYGIVDAAGTSWEFASLGGSFKDIPDALMGGRSVVYAQPLGDGAGNRAILLKPVGIDQIFTDFFDDTQFRLESVASWMNDGYRKIRTLTPVWTGSALANSCGPFRSSGWMPSAISGGTESMTGHTMRPGQINFQLRNLITNQVSELSQGSVFWLHRKRRLPLAALVRNGAR